MTASEVFLQSSRRVKGLMDGPFHGVSHPLERVSLLSKSRLFPIGPDRVLLR